MISWKEVAPDYQSWTISEYFRELTVPDVITLGLTAANDIALVVHEAVEMSVRKHVSEHSCEVGGLLVGRICRGNVNTREKEILIVSIEQSVPSQAFTGTGVSLRMEPEIWSNTEKYLSGKRAIVGWYHSHPNLGAFFSGTDRKTQSDFFHHDYSFGWVIDHVRTEEKWFRGAKSESFSETQLLRFKK